MDFSFAKFIREKFGKDNLNEGNPLARVKKFGDEGRHFVAISAVRPNYTDAENEQRTAELKKKISALGYGFREAEGHWEGGKEKSIVVNAAAPGNEHGRSLVKDMRRLAKEYEQHSIYHHNGDAGHEIGTSESGRLGTTGVERAGRAQYNRPAAPFQTELRPKSNKPLKPGRTSKGSARFTSGDDDGKNIP